MSLDTVERSFPPPPPPRVEISRKRRRSLSEIEYAKTDAKKLKIDDEENSETNVQDIFERWNPPLADLMALFFFSGMEIRNRSAYKDDTEIGKIAKGEKKTAIVSDGNDFLRRWETTGSIGNRLVEHSKKERTRSTFALSALKDVCNLAMSCRFFYDNFDSSSMWKMLQTAFDVFCTKTTAAFAPLALRRSEEEKIDNAVDFYSSDRRKDFSTSPLSSRRCKKKYATDLGKEKLLDRIVGSTMDLERTIRMTLVASSATAVDVIQTLRERMPDDHVLVSVKRPKSGEVYFEMATGDDALDSLVSMPVSNFLYLKHTADALYARKKISCPKFDDPHIRPHKETSSKTKVCGA